MCSHTHEGITLYDHIVRIGGSVSGRKVECSQFGSIFCLVLDILESPVTQCDDGCLLGREQCGCLIGTHTQRILAHDTGVEQFISLAVCFVDVCSLGERLILSCHGVPVLSVTGFQCGHELHVRVIRPLILESTGNCHEVGIVFSIIIL